MRQNIPNILTFIRLLCAIAMPIIIIMNQELKLLLLLLFFIGGVTDWLDGYIAKNYQLTSKVGEILDPIADKALVICALMVLIHLDSSLLLLTSSIVIILREFVVSALRQILSSMSNNPLKVNFISKVKAAIQMLGIGTCFFGLAFNYPTFYQVGIYAIAISAVLTVFAFMTYFNKVRPLLARA